MSNVHWVDFFVEMEECNMGKRIMSNIEYAPRKKSLLQKFMHFLAVFDILAFLGTVIAAYQTEKYICFEKPRKIPWVLQLTSSNASITDEEFNAVHETTSMWSYLDQLQYKSEILFNAVYMAFLFASVSYIILEIWICCVIIRGANEKSILLTRKALWCRSGLLLLTVLAMIPDLLKWQYTCTMISFLPLMFLRIFTILFLSRYLNSLKDREVKW